jgi:hypothetical protein
MATFSHCLPFENKVLLKCGTFIHLFIFTPQQQCQEASTEAICLAKPHLFILWLFTEKV